MSVNHGGMQNERRETRGGGEAHNRPANAKGACGVQAAPLAGGLAACAG